MSNLYNIFGKLTLKFKNKWGVTEKSAGLRNTSITLKQIPVYDNQNNSSRLMYWIPSSALKGSLRSVAHRLDDKSCNSPHISNEESCFKIIEKDKSKTPCKVCTLFGSGVYGYYPSKIRLSSIMLPTNKEVIVSPHVSINRKSRTSNKGSLFFDELFTPSTKLSLTIEAYSLDENERDFVINCLKLWGKFGLGYKSTPFDVEGLNKLSIKCRGNKMEEIQND